MLVLKGHDMLCTIQVVCKEEWKKQDSDVPAVSSRSLEGLMDYGSHPLEAHARLILERP